MDNATIKFSYIDSDRRERTGTWEGDPAEALVEATAFLDAESVGDDWVWYADEDDGYYVSTCAEMKHLGAALLSGYDEREHDVYSLWCGSAREATPAEEAAYHGEEVAS